MGMSALISSEENGPAFELRGLHLARALHDPSGTQGAMMILGRERDGVFVSHDAVNAYEFTTDARKDKAVKDAEKLGQLLDHLAKDRTNALKPMTGWFVTRDEPTADQRTAVSHVARRMGRQIHAVSIAQLYTRICDTEAYLQARDRAPFGSTSFTPDLPGKAVRVPVRMVSASGSESGIAEAATGLLGGRRLLVVGDYGAGKSHALRDLYLSLRRTHFKKGRLTPFPLHINLRDCAGLKTPAEIIRRHAEEIGFDHAAGLISAWRAGMCVLLLDGFDEILPSRWLGSVADLKTVRWDALSPLRRLVEETPSSAGVIVAGRSHYFSGQAEMTAALGFKPLEILSIPDFDEVQLAEFLKQSGAAWSLPDWVPARPLLLGYLASLGEDTGSAVAGAVTAAAGWRTFLDAICVREAKMFSAVRPETIERIIARTATLARGGSSTTGPLSIEQLRSAFVSVNGFQPDEEGVQLLMRLPGLTSAHGPSGAEMRSFADDDLSETAYGIDLASYVRDPYGDSHPLSGPASWVNASHGLAAEVAAGDLLADNLAAGLVLAAMNKRQNAGRHDAVLADLLSVLVAMQPGGESAAGSFLVSGVAFTSLEVVDHPSMASTTFQDCLIERLDLHLVDERLQTPQFQSCLVTFVVGASALPAWLEPKFTGSEIENFDHASQTTAGIMQLKIDRDSRVALTVLKKIFSQRGSGRREGALSRGLSLQDRGVVPSVLSELVSQGWIVREGAGGNAFYVGVRERRRDAHRALETPADFRLK